MLPTPAVTAPDPNLAATFIIPTFNRLDALKLCLRHLEQQTRTDFEVVLIDDGSSDGTAAWVSSFLASTTLRLRFHRQRNAGPARARNVAVRLAASPLCLIIGDDILCSPGFADAHIRFHQANPAPHLAGLGLTRWDESHQVVTPFMRWMDSSGTQFAYGDLLAGLAPDWRHFYTSNLSLKTSLLLQHPFSEQFPSASMEDMELGFRLEQEANLKVTFLPEALAGHVHPIDFARACKRAQGTGRSLVVFDRLWPNRPQPPHGRTFSVLRDMLVRNRWILPPLTALTGFVTRFRCPNPLIRFTLMFHTAVARRQQR